MEMRSFIKINNLILDKMINEKFYYFIENKNKKDNRKFKLCLKVNLISQQEKSFLKHFYLIKYL